MGPKIKIAFIGTVILMLMLSVVWMDSRIKASVLEIARSRVQIRETEIINEIVNREVVAKTSYEDLVKIHKDRNGRIVLIQPNSIMINKIMASTTVRITESLGQTHEESISVPLGQITGSTLLAGYGPRIKVKIIPSGQVHVEIINKFDEAGVNQTRHLIYFRIQSDMKIAVPLMGEELKVSTTVPLAETIIIGDVPRTYVNYKEKSELPYSVINEGQELDD